MKKKDRKSAKSVSAVPIAPVPVWKLVVAWSILFWAVFVVNTFDAKFPASIDAALHLLDGFLDFSAAKFFVVALSYVKSILMAAVFAFSAAGWGALALPREEAHPLAPLERLLLGIGIGFLGLSTSLFLLGIAGGFGKVPLVIFAVAFAAGGLTLCRREWPEWSALLRRIQFSWPFHSPANFLVTLMVAFAIVMAFVPELFYDSLVYHLGLPQMFVNEGRLVNTQHVYFSRFPMMMHMLYVLGLGLDGQILAKLFNTMTMLVGLGGLSAVCGRLGWRKTGPWAALFILVIPVTQLNVWSTAIDSAMGTYTVFALLAFLMWREGGYTSNRALVIFSLMAGTVFGIKYTGVVLIIAFGILLLFCRPSERPWPSLVKNLFIYGVVVFVVMAPWLIRNVIWTGNPTYPILSSIFPSRDIHQKKMNQEQELVSKLVPKSIKQIVSYPWMITMLEITNFNFIGPVTMASVPFLFFIPWRERRDLWLLGGFTFFYFLFALHFSGDIRYLLPGFFILSLWLAGGVNASYELKPLAGLIARGTILVACCYQLVWVFMCAQGLYKPGPVVMGGQSRYDYSATMHDGLNLWPWNGMAADLMKLPEPCRIYILGNEQVAGFPRRFWYSSVHDHTPLVLWANQAADSNALLQKLKSEGFTHILINVPEAMRLKGYELYPWTDAGRATFIDFANRHLQVTMVRPIMQYADSLFLFEIKDSVDATKTVGDFGHFFKDVLNLKAS